MVCEGAVEPGNHIGPALPIIRSGELATRETNVQQARRNHHVSEFRSSSGVNGINTEFLHSRGDGIEVPNNFLGVMVRKWRGAQVFVSSGSISSVMIVGHAPESPKAM
ncbi:hypothetical protein AAC387_Pa02g1501 [Persea americana]